MATNENLESVSSEANHSSTWAKRVSDPAADHGRASAAVVVSISETAGAVLLRIEVSGDVEPGSIDIRFAGLETVVLARDTQGRAIRSQSLRLPALVSEEDASADHAAAGALVMTLRKRVADRNTDLAADPETRLR